MTIDISPIIAGNANLFYADSEMFEPDLQREFMKAVTARVENTLVAAELTRQAKGSTIWESGDDATGIDGSGNSDTLIDGMVSSDVLATATPTATQFTVTNGDTLFASGMTITVNGEERTISGVAGTDRITVGTALSAAPSVGDIVTGINPARNIDIGSIKYESWQDNPLTITRTAASTFSFITAADVDGQLNGKSLYLQRDGNTVELPFLVAIKTTTALIWPRPLDNDDNAILGFVLGGANTDDKIKIRIADSEGTEGIAGQNSFWTELGKNLVMETGTSATLNQTTTDLRVLSETLPIEQFTTQEMFTASATLYDVSVEALAYLQNRQSVRKVPVVAGNSAGYRTAELERGPRPVKSALVIRMESTPYLETGGESQWWFPRCTITSNTAFPISKTATAIPVTFTVLRSNLYDKALKFTAQEGAFSI